MLGVTLVLILSGCASWRLNSEVEEARAEALRKIDVKACEKQGGKVEGIGIFGIPACVQYYSDGGKICRDKSECQGYCFIPEQLERGKSAVGKCEASEHDSFGCFSRIEDGKVATSMCQD
jgi:hypothetical protein